ncbi:hypothetical protein D1007_36998 [Hordeum vulgare]|nr:hypothetical protein D1007_36998 [Hordeum vulgare]
MFFETTRSTSALVPPRLESSRTGLVKVTNGTLTVEQVSQQLKRLVSETYQWAPVRVDEHIYQVEFPRREDLQRLLTFGVSKVSGSKCLLGFEEYKKLEPQGARLEKVWIRFSGIPQVLLNDFLIVSSIGSLVVKTEKVDMPFTRKQGIARLLVTVLDVECIPDFAPLSYDGVHYDLDVEVEETQPQSHDGDVHMADGDDRDGDHGDVNQDKHSEKTKEDRNPSSSTATDKPLNAAIAPTYTPMNTLRFGSFEVIPTQSRLWGVQGVQDNSWARSVDVDATVHVDQLDGEDDTRLGLQFTPASTGALEEPLGNSRARLQQRDVQEIRQPGHLMTSVSSGSSAIGDIGQEARAYPTCTTSNLCQLT